METCRSTYCTYVRTVACRAVVLRVEWRTHLLDFILESRAVERNVDAPVVVELLVVSCRELETSILDFSIVGIYRRETCRRTHLLPEEEVLRVTLEPIDSDIEIACKDTEVDTDVGLLVGLPLEVSINEVAIETCSHVVVATEVTDGSTLLIELILGSIRLEGSC